jgi:hypothetical protein
MLGNRNESSARCLSGPRSKQRWIPFLELLEHRLAPTGTTVLVPLDRIADEFGNQIITVQAYETSARAAFGIFDTGASALTFSAGDQARFSALGVPIPIKVPRGAEAEGLGGTIIGDVSNPGTILADGLHAANLSFDSLGHAQFAIQFGSGSAYTPRIQAFVGTQDGSPLLPTITGMQILNGGLAALVTMSGATLDFSQAIPNLVLSLPDLSFVPSGTALTVGPDSQNPVRVPLTLVGFDNYLSPGNSISEARVPVQNDVSLFNGRHGSIKEQSFLFDTGAQVTVISTRDAQALGLDLQHPEFSTLLEGVGGSQRVGGYTIAELDLPTSDGGSVRFGDVPVFVADLGQGVDGVLGMNLLNTATAMLYDPFGTGGASVSFTFSRLAHAAAGDPPDLVSKLDRLGVSFAGAIQGSQLPGLALNTGKVSGQVFVDYNGNGVAEQGEPGLAGQTVFLDLNNSGQLDPGDPTATTDPNGFYQFTGLAAGTYTVRELLPAGFTVLGSFGASTRVVLPGGGTVNAVSFANLAMQPNPTAAFVAELYGDLLDRAPDAAGLANWVAQVNQGMPREEAARVIWDSAEHRGLEVDSYYQNFLHRPADAAGRMGWVSALLSGLSEGQVEQGFLMSPEYQVTHASDSTLIAGLYGDVLGRQPSSADSVAWELAIQNGTARAQILQAILTSDESYLHSLDAFYEGFLHRLPDVAGQQTWLTLLRAGRICPEQAGEALLGSNEFFSWAGQLSRS